MSAWGAVALVLHLALLVPYAASGLVAPAYGVALLLALWAGLLVLLLRWRRSPRALLAPLVAALLWPVLVSVGEAALGRTA